MSEPLLHPEPVASTGPRQFPCSQCGASLTFAVGTTHLVCSYCQQSNAIPLEAAPIHELDYQDHLGRLAEEADTELVVTVSCDGCAAQISSQDQEVGGATAFDCPFCGHAINTQGQSRRQIRPRSLLPFAVRPEQARDAFRQWLKSRWFLPSKLARRGRQHEQLTGIYLPYWTYDANTSSNYTGQRGDHYWVTKHYTTRVNGKNVSKTRRVRKTRWRSASGRVAVSFDDVLVLASTTLPPELTDCLEPWDLSDLVPFDAAFLAGFRAEVYQADLAQGFSDARIKMEPAIRASICRDIGGDKQRIHNVSTEHSDVTFKHLLLPVWSSAFRWNNRVFRFVINGQTGEVQGERPYSPWKIAGAGALALVAVGVVVGFLALASS